jgi:Flp pilus assembly protein TadD
MIALKKISKLFLRRDDYSNAYIYINKAIKLDEEEAGLWNLLSQYYMKNGDYAKYYECIMKELEIEKFHTNSFLNGLIPKIII